MPLPKIEQQDAKVLAAGYSGAFRKVEIASIVAFLGLMAGIGWRVAPHVKDSPWLVLSAFILGYIGADFVSGFVHWMADTWGSTDMPILGKAFVRPFREHHVDQKAITRHDFIETNGANCLISLWVAVIAFMTPLDSKLGLFWAVWSASLILWVMFTNQFHKWAHEDNPAGWVSFLQRWHLILPPAHHKIHHTAPFSRYYCITVGWLNKPLYKVGFFQTLERLVTALTGMMPRADDIGVAAATTVAAIQKAEFAASSVLPTAEDVKAAVSDVKAAVSDVKAAVSPSPHPQKY